ncbi:Surface antigen [Limimonas halophila]|uniref:17 kDa surface antigen n=1 Tax=Limimonas halophila TaxID=1082479 RepID=A0A1G7PWE7_9PROT|nr:RT0821/Lpp0805 family surface protein [Limimonas halophila]SDF90571.1 Surface antigen [Limimonas halophila]
MTVRRILAALALTAMVAAGCANSGDQPGPKQSIGTIGGAILGGFLGSKVGGGKGQLWATGAGAAVGALIGSEFGKSLDRADRIYAARTTQAALEHTKSGQTSTWSNPDSGNSGKVTPTETFQRADGTYCREFQQTVTVGGETQQAYGTACRQPDGSWKII